MIIALALSAALAVCHAEATTSFEQLRAQALQHYPAASAELARTQFDLGRNVGVGDNDAYGITLTSRKGTQILLSTEVCDMPAAQRDAVLAHELGHVVSQSLDKFKILFSFSYNVEQAADNYGAALLSAKQRDDLATYLGQQCAADPDYWCQRGARWQVAFNQ